MTDLAAPPQPSQAQAMAQLASLLQPVSLRTQTIAVNGKNMVMVEVARPAE